MESSKLKQGVLAGLSTSELQGVAASCGEKPFRGKQIGKWIYEKAVFDIDRMVDIPASFREALKQQFVVSKLQLASKRSSQDGVEKLLMHNGDEQVYESVLLPYKDRVSCCISSQVGCPMGCTFCATGLGGFDRNLDASEIIGQYLMLQALANEKLPKPRISHVVYMGMGEPLLNLKNVVKSMELLHDEVGLSYRHITVSTVGLVPQIKELQELNIPINLALSLHSPFDEVRDKLMPVNHKWPVKEVVGTMKNYARATGRKVTFEYLLIDNVNDTIEQAEALSSLVAGVPSVVNLIPFNWVDTGNGFARPSNQRIKKFREVLENKKVAVTQRVERGHDIAAACGQLAGIHKGRFAKRTSSISVNSA